jgi:hypothetical protein
MFIIPFTVFFNIKKGTLVTYLAFWKYNYYDALKLLFLKTQNLRNLNSHSNFRYQFTILTCKTTIYVLFIFWNFFFFFGETLLLILFNFGTLTDSIYSDSFFIFKNHFPFLISTFSFFLSQTIFFFISFLTLSALVFLLTYRYDFYYKYFNFILTIETFFLILIGLTFKHWILFFFLVYIFIHNLNNNKLVNDNR